MHNSERNTAPLSLLDQIHAVKKYANRVGWYELAQWLNTAFAVDYLRRGNSASQNDLSWIDGSCAALSESARQMESLLSALADAERKLADAMWGYCENHKRTWRELSALAANLNNEDDSCVGCAYVEAIQYVDAIGAAIFDGGPTGDPIAILREQREGAERESKIAYERIAFLEKQRDELQAANTREVKARRLMRGQWREQAAYLKQRVEEERQRANDAEKRAKEAEQLVYDAAGVILEKELANSGLTRKLATVGSDLRDLKRKTYAKACHKNSLTDSEVYAVVADILAAIDASAGEDVPVNKNRSHCADCSMQYGGAGWFDLTLPDDQWALIQPREDGAGILCANCIARRAKRLPGADAIRAVISFAPGDAAEPEVTFVAIGCHNGEHSKCLRVIAGLECACPCHRGDYGAEVTTAPQPSAILPPEHGRSFHPPTRKTNYYCKHKEGHEQCECEFPVAELGLEAKDGNS